MPCDCHVTAMWLEKILQISRPIPEVITYFMLNPTEHEICPTQKCLNVGILSFISWINFMLAVFLGLV